MDQTLLVYRAHLIVHVVLVFIDPFRRSLFGIKFKPRIHGVVTRGGPLGQHLTQLPYGNLILHTL